MFNWKIFNMDWFARINLPKERLIAHSLTSIRWKRLKEPKARQKSARIQNVHLNVHGWITSCSWPSLPITTSNSPYLVTPKNVDDRYSMKSFPLFFKRYFPSGAPQPAPTVSLVEFVWKRDKMRLAWPPFPAGHQRPESGRPTVVNVLINNNVHPTVNQVIKENWVEYHFPFYGLHR